MAYTVPNEGLAIQVATTPYAHSENADGVTSGLRNLIEQTVPVCHTGVRFGTPWGNRFLQFRRR